VTREPISGILPPREAVAPVSGADRWIRFGLLLGAALLVAAFVLGLQYESRSTGGGRAAMAGFRR